MKSLRDWINEERGRSAALAAHLCVSPARVTQIADAGVPVKFMLQVLGFTRGAVTLESMVVNRQHLARKPRAKAQQTAEASHA
jgi:hypothetical protein